MESCPTHAGTGVAGDPGITDRLNMADADDAQTVHRIVEATKRAFALRDAHITDPRHLDVDVQQLLTPEALQPLADSIDDASASPGRRQRPGRYRLDGRRG